MIRCNCGLVGGHVDKVMPFKFPTSSATLSSPYNNKKNSKKKNSLEKQFRKPIPKRYSPTNSISRAIKMKYRSNRLKQRMEYDKLRRLVPQISNVPKCRLSKLTILEETIKHIAYLEEQVLNKYQGLLPPTGEESCYPDRLSTRSYDALDEESQVQTVVSNNGSTLSNITPLNHHLSHSRSHLTSHDSSNEDDT